MLLVFRKKKKKRKEEKNNRKRISQCFLVTVTLEYLSGVPHVSWNLRGVSNEQFFFPFLLRSCRLLPSPGQFFSSFYRIGIGVES